MPKRRQTATFDVLKTTDKTDIYCINRWKSLTFALFLRLRIMSEELTAKVSNQPESQQLYSDVCHIIDDTRTRVAVYFNAEVSRTYWYIGKRIKEDVLYNRRADYGKQVVKNLSLRLTERYGKGWNYSTLQHCVRAAYTFTEDEIAYAVRTQFSWTSLRTLMSVSDPLARGRRIAHRTYSLQRREHRAH